MPEMLFSGAYAAFTLSLALLFGLLALELIALLVGGSLLGDGAEPEFDVPDIADIPEIDIDGLDIDPGEFEVTVAEDIATETLEPPASPLAWLGLGRMPTLLWLATMCLSFGVSGYVLQGLVTTLIGGPLPALFATLPAAFAAIWFTSRFGAGFARILPQTETESISRSSLARRRGTVTQGTAARGHPAEVRVTDGYGNAHYLRAEPLEDDAQIPQGSDVIVLRHRPTGQFRLVNLSA